MVLNAGEGVITYVFSQLNDPQAQVITIGMFNQNPATTADMNALMSHWDSTFKSDTISTYTLLRVEERFSMDGANETVVQSDVVGIQGTNATAGLPSNCAVIMKKNSGSTGRRRRGRCYWPGIPESIVDDLGFLTAGGVSTWGGNFGSLFVALDTATRTPAIIHVDHGPHTQLVSFTCALQIGTQRRRMRR